MGMSMEEFVLSNKNIIVKLAKYYCGIAKDYGIEFDDLYQVGCLALIEKYDSYDESRGNTLTYAIYVLRISMLNYINKNNTITYTPVNIITYVNWLFNKDLKFYQINGRNMTEEELILCIDENNYTSNKKDIKFIRKLIEIYKSHFRDNFISLSQQFVMKDDYNDNIYLEECISLQDSLEDEVISKITYEELLKKVTKNINTPINYNIFMEVSGLNDDIPKTRTELAKKYNISPQAVAERYSRTLKRLRKKINISE